jgi:hypothetical protein
MSLLQAVPDSEPSPRPGQPAADEEPRVAPVDFRRAVAALTTTTVRPEVLLEPIRPPQRLAPWSYALSATVRGSDGSELSLGRLVLLHDPDGAEAWEGTLRLVAFASAELDPEILTDPLLPQVGWSWLVDSLADRGADAVAAGGTVTQTVSTRFGDLHGPRTTVSIELRGSWTPTSPELGPHLLAFCDLLCTAAGLPPEGVSVLSTG